MVEMDLTWPRWPNWQAESLPSISDLRAVLVFAFFIVVVRFCLSKLVFENLGRRFISGYQGLFEDFFRRGRS